MKKLKLFPKTFLYICSLVAFIALLSHALFYFFMPVVYTGQKEAKFQSVLTDLTEELNKANADERQSIVKRFAFSNQMGIILTCDGETYSYMSESITSSQSESFMQDITTHWQMDAVILLLPLTLLICLLLSVLFVLLYSRKITRPLAEISEVTERMKRLDPVVGCDVKTHDEIGVLSENINALYQSLPY